MSFKDTLQLKFKKKGNIFNANVNKKRADKIDFNS